MPWRMTKAVVEHMYEKHYLSDYLEVESQSATNVTIQSLGLGVFEDTFENAQWRKVKQMQMNATKYKYAYSRAGNLRTYLKTHSGYK